MNTPTITWKLNDSQFTLIDRAKLAWFVLSDNQWTQSKHTAEFECKMAQFVGSKYAVFVANGSLANTLIAMYLKGQTCGNANRKYGCVSFHNMDDINFPVYQGGV